jgi:glycerol-3-phosphate acyltransferase PlsX
MGKAEVYVCDWFTGNIIFKFAESIYDIVQNRKIKDEYFNRFNFEMYGGVPVLGVNKPVIIGHGISTSGAFNNMIVMAKKMIDEQFIEKIKSNFL